MGIIKSQSIQSTFIIYIGIVIGYINTAFLFPKYLGPEYYGLLQTILAISMITAQIARLGIPNVIIKFFPRFRNKTEQHNGFIPFILLLSLIGITLFVLSYYLSSDHIRQLLNINSPLVSEYFYLVVPLTIFIIYLDIFSNYSISLFKPSFASFVRDVFIRSFILCSFILHLFQWITIEQFLYFYIIAYGISSVILLFYFKLKGELFLQTKWSFITKKFRKEIANYAFFSILAGSASVIISRLDMIMITALISTEATGVYATAFYISAVIFIPTRAINQITSPIISSAWEQNNLNEIKKIYEQSSLIQLLSGIFLFIIIWLNIDNLFHFLPETYQNGKYVFLWIGLAKIFDMATGCNNAIISYSKHYKFILYSNLFLVALIILSNLILIPLYGINGAAIATSLSIFMFNFAKLLFIWKKMKIQPFSKYTIWILIISLITFLLAKAIPTAEITTTTSTIYDLIIKSATVSIVYLGLCYCFNVSTHFNTLVKEVFQKIKNLIG